MGEKIRIFFATTIILFLIYPLNAQVQVKNAYIEWEPVEGAMKYKVLFADKKGNFIFEKIINTTKMDVNLPYGKYQYRVAVINKFNKISRWSEWHILNIVPALEPHIYTATPHELSRKSKSSTILITGINFYRNTKVIIQKPDSIITVKKLNYLDPKTLSIEVDTSKAKPGKYDLIVKNPGDLKTIHLASFILQAEPALTGMKYYTGIESGYSLYPVVGKDAYAGAISLKLFCEFHSLGQEAKLLAFLNKAPGLYPGIQVSFYDYMQPKQSFGPSYMLQTGIYLGYEFSFPLRGELLWHISPVLGYKQYFRWHTYSSGNLLGTSEVFFGTNSILFAGFNITFNLPKNFLIGFSADYNVILERKSIQTIGFFLRVGYKI